MCTNYSKITEFYLADDIIQGEEIPFYLLWKGEDPMKICFEFEGSRIIGAILAGLVYPRLAGKAKKES